MSHRLIGRTGCLAIFTLLLAVATAAAPAALAQPARSGARAVPGLPPGPVDDALGTSVAVSGAIAMVGAPDVNNGAGAVFIYRRAGGRWRLGAVLTDPANRPGDDFGWSVAMADGTALIGAPASTYNASGPPGVVYSYAGSGTRWRLRAMLTAPHPSGGDSFGTSVALAGSQALVGESGYQQPSYAYIYLRSAGHWRLRATLASPRHAAGADVPVVTALSSSVAVLGAPGVNAGSGTVTIYRRDGTTWRRQVVLTDPGPLAGDFFGSGLALHGSTLMIGAWGAGAVYVYGRSGANWTQTSVIRNSLHVGNYGQAVVTNGKVAFFSSLGSTAVYTSSGSGWTFRYLLRTPADQYGPALAFDGTTLVAGAGTGADSSVGAGLVFTLRGGSWRRQAVLSDPDGHPGDYKGSAVAVSGSAAVAGAWGKYGQEGMAFIYARVHGSWRQQVRVRDPSRHYFDKFGLSVAASGPLVAIGAPQAGNSDGGQVFLYARRHGRWDLQATIGDPGNYLEDAFGSAVAMAGRTLVVTAEGAGVAYVFVRAGARWLRRGVLRDPGRGADLFGATAAVSGSTVVIGAAGTRDDAGAAYVYSRSAGRWRLRQTLADPRGNPDDEFGTSVAVSGTTAVIGAPGAADFSGAAYAYARSGGRWRRQATLAITPRADVAGGFGGSAAITGSGTRAVAVIGGVAVSGLATAAHRCGRAFEFGRRAGKWRKLGQIADPRCTPYDEFGYALAISGRTVVIGAPGTSGNAGTIWVRALRYGTSTR